MNKKKYLFDIDGTLTEPRQKMDYSFSMQFLSWMINKDVFFVTGSDKQKVDEQLPSSIMKRCDGVFCSMANEFWQKDKLIYRNKFLLERIYHYDLYHPTLFHSCRVGVNSERLFL